MNRHLVEWLRRERTKLHARLAEVRDPTLRAFYRREIATLAKRLLATDPTESEFYGLTSEAPCGKVTQSEVS